MKGFSVVEFVIVLVVIMILGAISLPYVYNYQRVYKSEDQSMKIMDLMNETSQLALNRRRTFRFELDLTANKALIIDENGPGNADDTEVKAIPLEPPSEIRLDQAPSGVTSPNPPNYNNMGFAPDTTGHRLRDLVTVVNGNNVWAARFRSDGSVVDAAGNLRSATCYVWPPRSAGDSNARNLQEVRAITLFGGSGAIRYWKYNGSTFLPY